MTDSRRIDHGIPVKPISALVIDMDGVLWRGNEILPGFHPFFDLLKETGIPYVLATNNASQSPDSYAQRLNSLGVDIQPQSILTSGETASRILPQHCPPPGPIYVIGSQALRTTLAARGYEFVTSGEEAHGVVVGFDRQITWNRMAEAALALNAGAFFMGTNPDTSFPSERGLVPGNGAILAALTAATGVEPLIVGKPQVGMYAVTVETLSKPAEQILAIGDRLETDILGGARAGMQTALILTGVSSVADMAQVETKPDYTFQDLPELTEFLASQWQA